MKTNQHLFGSPMIISGNYAEIQLPVPSGVPSVVPSADEKRKLITQQLVVLMHARQCMRRKQNPDAQQATCGLPHCSTMKNVLIHMKSCQEGMLSFMIVINLKKLFAKIVCSSISRR